MERKPISEMELSRMGDRDLLITMVTRLDVVWCHDLPEITEHLSRINGSIGHLKDRQTALETHCNLISGFGEDGM